jgi:CrcB protein
VDRRERLLIRLAGRARIDTGGIDPDLADDDQPARRIAPPQPAGAGARWPSVHWPVVAVIALGGFAGGLTRYAIDHSWATTTGSFPWATFAINTSGAFALALLLAIAIEHFPTNRYLRPLLGTGFCGAYTTFSSVAVDTDRLSAHGHAGLAAVYVLANLFAGLSATLAGITLGRSVGSERARQSA